MNTHRIIFFILYITFSAVVIILLNGTSQLGEGSSFSRSQRDLVTSDERARFIDPFQEFTWEKRDKALSHQRTNLFFKNGEHVDTSTFATTSPSGKFVYSKNCEGTLCSPKLTEVSTKRSIPLPALGVVWFDEEYLVGTTYSQEEHGIFFIPLDEFELLYEIASSLGKYKEWNIYGIEPNNELIFGQIFKIDFAIKYEFIRYADTGSWWNKYYWGIDLVPEGVYFNVTNIDSGYTNKYFFDREKKTTILKDN